MKQQYVNDALQKFAKTVITQSKANLTRGKKNVNRKLYDSLAYELNVHKQSFSLAIFMEEYGKFQDKGVDGTEVKHSSPYSFKSKQPPSQPIAEWAKARRIRFRDDKGRYTVGNYKTIGFIIARSIKKKGIKPSLFFTKPFEKHFENLPDDIIEAYGLDIDNIL
jgi:hypothetical protein